MDMRKSRTFKRIFLSYLTIIVLCFAAYSAVLLYETASVRREQADQFYKLKARELVYELESRIQRAESIRSNLSASSALNQLYRSAMTGESVDSYLLYQVMNDIRQQKSASAELGIYGVACFLNGYDRVYASEEVPRLSEAFKLTEQTFPVLRYTKLNELAGTESKSLTFSKEFLIFGDLYRYRSGTARGLICVLFDADRLSSRMQTVVGSGAGWQLLYNGELVFSGGRESAAHEVEQRASSVQGLSVKVVPDPAMYRLRPSAVWTVALGIGALVSAVFMMIALLYSKRFAAPLYRIWSLIGKAEGEDGFDELVEGVERLEQERDGYKNEILTISPYAKSGMLHSLLSGGIDGIERGGLYKKDVLSFENAFFMAGVINLFCADDSAGGREAVKRVKSELHRYAAARSSDARLRFICFERDFSNMYLLINTEYGEEAEEQLYNFYQGAVQRLASEPVQLTIGADEVTTQLADVPQCCQNAATALNRILLEGRGAVYFYDGSSSGRYYFPKEVTRQLTAMLSEGRLADLHAFLAELKKKNLEELDLSNKAITLLLDDLYVSTVKAVQNVNAAYGMEIHVEKLPQNMSFDEVEEYYRHVYEIVVEELTKRKAQKSDAQQEKRIIAWVDAHFCDPEISLAQIAEEHQVSTKYITCLFKQETGITYLQYVQERRIAYAAHLMRHTALSLEELAHQSGYTNMLTFRRNFKSIMGMNPSDFMEQERG